MYVMCVCDVCIIRLCCTKEGKVWLLDAFNMLSTVYSRQLKSQVIRDLVLFEYV